MISLRLALFVALFPVLTSGVDLGALLWSSRDSTQVMCRYVFFSYVFIFTVTIVAVHAYASLIRPEKKQYTYTIKAPRNPNDAELTLIDAPE